MTTIKDESIEETVLRIVADQFSLPPGDHLRSLRFTGDIGCNAEDMSVLVEEIGIQIKAVPLELAGRMFQCETVADLAALAKQLEVPLASNPSVE